MSLPSGETTFRDQRKHTSRSWESTKSDTSHIQFVHFSFGSDTKDIKHAVLDKIKITDGEVYRNVRTCELGQRNSEINTWMAHLSNCKQIALIQLLKHRKFRERFDALMPYPGLWDGLELGNIQRHLALHCDEEIVRYLDHIKSIWEQILQGRGDLRDAVDAKSVQSLQCRCPASSSIDRDFVIQAMESGFLFPKVVNLELRNILKESLLKVKCLIPSIKTLHENVKYLEVGAKLIKEMVIGRSSRKTIHATLFELWTDSPEIFIEVSEGVFRGESLTTFQERWDTVYKQIWLSVLRNFADLGGRAPRKETGHPAYSNTANTLLQYETVSCCQKLRIQLTQEMKGYLLDPTLESLRRSFTQIYRHHSVETINNIVEQVSAGLPRPPADAIHQPDIASDFNDLYDLNRRWGIPFQRSYLMGKSTLFFPFLEERNRNNAACKMPDSLFIYNDFIVSFFGTSCSSTSEVFEPPQNNEDHGFSIGNSALEHKAHTTHDAACKNEIGNEGSQDTFGIKPVTSQEPEVSVTANIGSGLSSLVNDDQPVSAAAEGIAQTDTDTGKIDSTNSVVELEPDLLKLNPSLQLDRNIPLNLDIMNEISNSSHFLIGKTRPCTPISITQADDSDKASNFTRIENGDRRSHPISIFDGQDIDRGGEPSFHLPDDLTRSNPLSIISDNFSASSRIVSFNKEMEISELQRSTTRSPPCSPPLSLTASSGTPSFVETRNLNPIIEDASDSASIDLPESIYRTAPVSLASSSNMILDEPEFPDLKNIEALADISPNAGLNEVQTVQSRVANPKKTSVSSLPPESPGSIVSLSRSDISASKDDSAMTEEQKVMPLLIPIPSLMGEVQEPSETQIANEKLPSIVPSNSSVQLSATPLMEVQTQPHVFNFWEYNSMTLKRCKKLETHMNNYLRVRRQWFTFVLRQKTRVFQTLQKKLVKEHMLRNPSLIYVFVAPDRGAWWREKGLSQFGQELLKDQAPNPGLVMDEIMPQIRGEDENIAGGRDESESELFPLASDSEPGSPCNDNAKQLHDNETSVNMDCTSVSPSTQPIATELVPLPNKLVPSASSPLPLQNDQETEILSKVNKRTVNALTTGPYYPSRAKRLKDDESEEE